LAQYTTSVNIYVFENRNDEKSYKYSKLYILLYYNVNIIIVVFSSKTLKLTKKLDLNCAPKLIILYNIGNIRSYSLLKWVNMIGVK